MDGDLPDGEDGQAGEDGPEVPGLPWRARYAAAYVCTDYQAHGHQPRWGRHTGQNSQEGGVGEEEIAQRKEAARVERRRVIGNNAAWRSAEDVRRDFLTTLLARRTPPKTTAAFVARALAHGHSEFNRAAADGHRLACQLFSVDPGSGYYGSTPDGLLSLLEGVSDTRAQVVTLGLVLAAYESATGTHSWRNPSQSTTTYLRFLADHGYTLSNIERLACGENPDPTPDTPAPQAS